MTIVGYLGDHRLQGAFIASRLQGLADLISDQGEALLDDAGLALPSRAVSTVLLIGERGEVSTAEIAKTLQQPHQLVAQRVELLIASGTVKRLADPDDGRRKILQLTPSGADQFVLLQDCLARTARAFGELFEEVGCDLPAITQRVADVLEEKPVRDRVRSL